MNSKNLAKAIAMALTGTALAAASLSASAQTNYTPNGSGSSAWNTNYDSSNVAGALSGSSSVSGSNGIFAWDGSNNTVAGKGYGWGHSATWFVFDLTSASNVSITVTSANTSHNSTSNFNANYNPAFSLWATTGYSDPANGYGNGHSFGHVNTGSAAGAGPIPWLTDPSEGGVTGIVGYANSGTTNWEDATGATVGAGGVFSGYSGSYSVGIGTATLSLTGLGPGEYLIAEGGSSACGAFASNTLGTCPPSGAGGFIANFTQSPVSAVPVPGAVWLFGSALAGLGLNRKRKIAA